MRFSGRYTLVSTGKAEFKRFTKGLPFGLETGSMTVCSSITLKGLDRHGAIVGLLMIHRGGQGREHMKLEIDREVQEGVQSGVLTWRVIAFHRAYDTNVGHTGSDLGFGSGRTDERLADEVLQIPGLEQSASQIHTMNEVGPKGTDGFYRSAIDIDGGGNCWHYRRTGYEQCKE
jgi:hypothetical protein